jgi:hypothetical protein
VFVRETTVPLFMSALPKQSYSPIEAERNARSSLLSLISVRAFRCQDCYHRSDGFISQTESIQF